MSGRKQHYIPQFLLRSFADEARGKKYQIRVTSKEKSFVVAADGAAAQREFYSGLDSDIETLDDVITAAESEYFKIFEDLRTRKSDGDVSSRDVARLVSHLAIRGNYIRQSFSTFGQYAIAKITQRFSDPEYFKALCGVNLSEPSSLMRKKFDEMYDGKRCLLREAKISRHEFRKIAHGELVKKWNEFFEENLEKISFLRSAINFDEVVRDGHIKSLAQDIEPAQRVESLEKLDWSIIDFDQPTLALPDCVALGHYPDIGLCLSVSLEKTICPASYSRFRPIARFAVVIIGLKPSLKFWPINSTFIQQYVAGILSLLRRLIGLTGCLQTVSVTR